MSSTLDDLDRELVDLNARVAHISENTNHLRAHVEEQTRILRAILLEMQKQSDPLALIGSLEKHLADSGGFTDGYVEAEPGDPAFQAKPKVNEANWSPRSR
jgi:hypothetical protein